MFGLKDKMREKINTALGEASVCWSDTKDGVSGVPVGEFDSSRAAKIGEELTNFVWDKLTGQAWLGNATTGELLDEIKARVDVNYKTVNEE